MHVVCVCVCVWYCQIMTSHNQSRLPPRNHFKEKLTALGMQTTRGKKTHLYQNQVCLGVKGQSLSYGNHGHRNVSSRTCKPVSSVMLG